MEMGKNPCLVEADSCLAKGSLSLAHWAVAAACAPLKKDHDA